MNIFERKVYRRILGPVYDNEKENWSQLTNKEIYVGLGMYREWKKIKFPKEYYIWILEQQDLEVDKEIDGKMKWGRMEV